LCLFRTGDKKDVIGGFMDSRSKSFLANFPQKPPVSALMNAREREIYTSLFRRSGFETGLCWYATARVNWEQEGWNWRDDGFDVRRPDWYRLNSSSPPAESEIRRLHTHIHTPALMITAGADYVLRPAMTGTRACDAA
jgi:hypothetical protein